METTLTFYSRPIAEVPSFKYLGRVIYSSKNDWLEVVHNLSKLWSKSVHLPRLMVREGLDARTLAMFYVTVFQALIIYRSLTLVMSLHIGRTLGRFHHRVVCILTGRKPKRRLDGTWYYPPLEKAMSWSGIQEVESYVALRQNTFITDLCLLVSWSPVKRVSK